MAKRKPLKFEPLADRDAVNAAISEIAELRRKIDDEVTGMDRSIDQIKTTRGTIIAGHERDLMTKAAAVQAWATENREELTKGGKRKTVPFTSGVVRWRKNPDKVVVARGMAVAALTFMQIMGNRFRQFIRFKNPEINKEALLANPELAAKVPGIKIQEGAEIFAIVPNATDIEELV